MRSNSSNEERRPQFFFIGDDDSRQLTTVAPSQKALRTIGITDEVRTQFYAITPERRLQHPAALAIRNEARQELFR